MSELFELAIVTPRLALTMPAYSDLQSLLSGAAGQIVPPEPEPGYDFVGPWAQTPPPQFQEQFILQQWRQRINFSPDNWTLSLAVWTESWMPAGMFTVWGKDFLQNRQLRIAFWSLPQWRGQGISKEAHRGLLHFLFQDLGAEEVWLRHHPEDVVTAHIAESLGYSKIGLEVAADNRNIEMQRCSLYPSPSFSSSPWQSQEDCTVVGAEDCLHLFGLSPALPGRPDIPGR